MDYAPGKSRHRFAACTARLSASEQTRHHAQFTWRGVAGLAATALLSTMMDTPQMVLPLFVR
jgi:hypothetical protein